MVRTSTAGDSGMNGVSVTAAFYWSNCLTMQCYMF